MFSFSAVLAKSSVVSVLILSDKTEKVVISSHGNHSLCLDDF